MTIDYVVKKQAIDLHLQGRGRNEIARILNGQKMRISEATITHLIQAWNRQYQQQKHEHNNSEPFSQSSSLEATTVSTATTTTTITITSVHRTRITIYVWL